jgi:hypothetical protein
MEFFDLSEASQAKKYWFLAFCLYFYHLYHFKIVSFYFILCSLYKMSFASKLYTDMLSSVTENLKLEGILSTL